MDSAYAALLGALIGSFIPVLGMVVQERFRSKRELLKTATEVATKNWEKTAELLMKSGKKVRIVPVSATINYHVRVLEAIRSGTFSPDWILEEGKRQREIDLAFHQNDEAYEQVRQERRSSE